MTSRYHDAEKVDSKQTRIPKLRISKLVILHDYVQFGQQLAMVWEN